MAELLIQDRRLRVNERGEGVEIHRQDPNANAILRRILEEPGDTTSRLAMADLITEADFECFATLLRRKGYYGVLRVTALGSVWWRLCWIVEHEDGECDQAHLQIAHLARSGLPRCATCGKRAHVACSPRWQWSCWKKKCLAAVNVFGTVEER